MSRRDGEGDKRSKLTEMIYSTTIYIYMANVSPIRVARTFVKMFRMLWRECLALNFYHQSEGGLLLSFEDRLWRRSSDVEYLIILLVGTILINFRILRIWGVFKKHVPRFFITSDESFRILIWKDKGSLPDRCLATISGQQNWKYREIFQERLINPSRGIIRRDSSSNIDCC